MYCAARREARAVLRATGLRTAAGPQGHSQAPEMPSLQLPTCEMLGLEVCKHFPRRSTFLSSKIVLRPQTQNLEAGPQEVQIFTAGDSMLSFDDP